MEELIPGFDYAGWYDSITGYSPHSQRFGAHVMLAQEDTLYVGFGTSFPQYSDGALLARVFSGQIDSLGILNEQGVHDFIWLNDTLYIPGTDPCCPDGWDGCNFYSFVPPNKFTKFRYDSAGNPILPDVVHLMGLWGNPISNKIYATTVGGVTNYLCKSYDHGITWTKLQNIVSSPQPRMIIFKNKLIILGYPSNSYYSVDSSGSILKHDLPRGGTWSDAYNSFANSSDKKLFMFTADDSVIATSDLYNWETIVPPTDTMFFSITYWPNEKSVILAETDYSGKIWKLNIESHLTLQVVH